jgi:general stress protein 26
MSKLGLKDISDAMKHVDICMLTTAAMESRPMSNNKDVDYDGDTYFFARDGEELIQDIEKDPEVNLTYIHAPAIVGKTLYMSVNGRAAVVRDRAEMKKHWVPDLDAWFQQGVDTPGLAMIRVKADTVKYWRGEENGVVKV